MTLGGEKLERCHVADTQSPVTSEQVGFQKERVMKKGRDVFKSFLAMLLQGVTMQTATKVKPASVMKPYGLPAAVLALMMCLVSTSTAAAFQLISNNAMSGATIKELVVVVDQRGPVLVLRTNEATGDGCSTFTIYDDQPGFNAFLAILMAAKVASRPIILAHGSAPGAPCLLAMVGPE